MAKAKRHVHKYRKVDLGYANVYACSLPDCPHYMPKHMEKILEGKYSFCWGCDEKFVMDEDALKMEHPKCINCRLGVAKQDESEAPVTDIIQKYLEKLEA